MMNNHLDTNHALDQMSQGLRRMVDQAEDLVKTAADTGDAKLEAALDKLQEQLRIIRRQLEGVEENLGRNIKQAARATDEQIHDHPYATAAVAGLIGLAAGLILARR